MIKLDKMQSLKQHNYTSKHLQKITSSFNLSLAHLYQNVSMVLQNGILELQQYVRLLSYKWLDASGSQKKRLT